ncbi:methyl-accepting chemotaxis protein [Rhizobium sp. BK591]|uniref:methyl-accepting chemotaxis protein n=1 Tax=unclassified Rhizobium TaxID=2613769 RepID=UPI00160E6233|nr:MULTISPECIES: methyl-accepting chemotaxis protein [unclassified Rhizobium]MBB3302034.1 methyl-accepting chemotaxis protein [Rhizobium sp. BK112]MBB3370975.1 methyl-accepting chemotaxis protein [Rhizobium sp. BK077]MBB3746523.1 methyl-accepting chemotaxis protein [Rhizobium sp. BK591]MBB4181743.1 methyl-accepting chemotaxis protein [Rhizobium sp. BK109]
MLGRLLSRVRIQTQVMVFIIPFVLSIMAVGATGFYASSLLQGRMDISNSVLQSLSGFRDLSAAMGEFLANATQENRDVVTRKLADQRTLLKAGIDKLAADRSGQQELEQAQSSIDGISTRMDSLWRLQENRAALLIDLQKALSVVVSSQTDIVEGTKVLQRAADSQEDEARNMLGDAQRISDFLSFAQAFNDKVQAAAGIGGPDMEELGRQQRVLAMALAGEAPGAKKAIDDAIVSLKPLVEATGQTEERAAGLSNAMGQIVGRLPELQAAAARRVKAATEKAAEIAKPVERAKTSQRDGQKLITSAYVIQIVMAKLTLAPTDANLQRLSQEITAVRKGLDMLISNAGSVAQFDKLRSKLLPALDKMQEAAADLVHISAQRQEEFRSAAADVDGMWSQLTAFAEMQRQNAAEERTDANSMSLGTTILGVVIAILAGVGLTVTLKGPINQITSAMRRLADGKLETSIVGERRADEIGDMARALGVFKNNAIAKVEIEERSEIERSKAEEERHRNDEEKRAVEEQIDFAVTALAQGLGRLAQGDISQTIATPFFGRLEQLRNDFNASLLRLQETIDQIRTNTRMIEGNAGQMDLAAGDLARRTEQQAVALEEIAAAIEEITTTVRSSAACADDAHQIITDTKQAADSSSQVVASAIDAMSKIEAASDEIVQIIGVIDEIAFQTNLLALNAGIEAARAGEAGKGFAVVAQEVRELAQRSAEAGQRIKQLIGRSQTEIANGARVVRETSEVLESISAKVVTASEQMDVIARSSREQYNALHEVNSSVNRMDQMTQQNAAMVEETSAATKELADETRILLQLIDQFQLAETDTLRRTAAA